MRCDEVSRKSGVFSQSRPYKKRKSSRKTKRPPGYRRPTLLLHKLQEAPGKKIRKKICTRCKENKFLNKFYITNKHNRGPAYKSECKKCTYARTKISIERTNKRKRQRGNPIYQAYQREYYKNNPEKFLEYRARILTRYPDYYKKKSQQRRMKLKEQTKEAKNALKDKDCT